MGDVVACESLVIKDNKILTVLPPNLGRLQSLTSLNLEKCIKLKELPSSLGELQSLTSLNLGNCDSLSELPPSLGELQSLTKLTLFRCKKLSGEVKDSLKKIVKARAEANNSEK